jgi:drug/metabolite transporter (DMT)-like permease
LRRAAWPRLRVAEIVYFAASIAAGGIAAPLLLMMGLKVLPATDASLLLNAEGVITSLIAWSVFRENFDRRIAVGMVAIVLGAVVLCWSPQLQLRQLYPALLVLAACLAWAIDNNFTRKLSLLDPLWLAAFKGLIAGSVNLAIAVKLGAQWPGATTVMEGFAVGGFAYGASLSLFIVGLRHLGAARTTAYFSISPFVGVLMAILWLHEPMTWQVLIAGGLMALGVWLHLTERHHHRHHHAALEHSHTHFHDEHHQHPHSPEVAADTTHTHWHRYEPLTHSHHHFPDAHHRHEH